MVEITITDIATDGRGIGYHQGRAVLVPYVVPGETLTVRIVGDEGEFAIGKGVTLQGPSADRILPGCSHFGKCGGCQWQHIDYPAQLALKTDIVATLLETAGGFREPPVQLTIGSPETWGYTHHTQFLPAPDGQLGFPTYDQTSVLPIAECPIAHPEIMTVIDELNLALDTLKSLDVWVNEAGERMLVLQTVDDSPPELKTTFPASLNFLLSHHEPFNMIGTTHIRQRIYDRTFRITAGVAYRANIRQVERLIEVVMHFLKLRRDQTILDLYGGIGTFSAFIAPYVSHVTYIDSYPPAATDAEENLADLDNIDIIEGRVDAVLSPDMDYNAAVVDPPKQGLNRTLMAALRVPTLVYVGQNPISFARDAKTLVREHGYRLLTVQPLDFAPHTTAITCVALFTRKT